MTSHAAFAAALLDPDAACPAGLTSWNGADPAKRYAVYRNNVIVGLVDALADTYPVVQALVGVTFFRAMAGVFVRQSPPRSPVLAWYGDGFADFIASFAPAAELRYLADVARLEWARVEAWHAADAPSLAVDALGALLDDPDRLAAARVKLHPALRLLTSAHPVVALWAAHQGDDPASELAQIDMAQAQAALLVRPGLDVEIYRIEAAALPFIAQWQAGKTFADAASDADKFDLPATLALLIRSGAISELID